MRCSTGMVGLVAVLLVWAPSVTAQPVPARPNAAWTAQVREVEREFTPPGDPRASAPQVRFTSTVLAEVRVRALPAGPLFWSVERFSTAGQAEQNRGAHGLVATDRSGGHWLVTLGATRNPSPQATSSDLVGPVTAVGASEYLLRVTQVTGGPGAADAAASHPGSLAGYVVEGQMCVRTSAGQTRLTAGDARVMADAHSAIQLSSCGGAELLALVLSVTDAALPFSSPARLSVAAPQPAGPEVDHGRE